VVGREAGRFATLVRTGLVNDTNDQSRQVKPRKGHDHSNEPARPPCQPAPGQPPRASQPRSHLSRVCSRRTGQAATDHTRWSARV